MKVPGTRLSLATGEMNRLPRLWLIDGDAQQYLSKHWCIYQGNDANGSKSFYILSRLLDRGLNWSKDANQGE